MRRARRIFGGALLAAVSYGAASTAGNPVPRMKNHRPFR